MKKIIFSAIAFCLTFQVCGSACLFVTMIVAGPHSDILPDWLGGIFALSALLFTLFISIFIAKKVYRDS